MDIKQLEIFLSVAKSLNFTKAAEEHFMTQPAVSHQITDLENEFGARLFHRTSHKVSLTAAGKELVPHAKQIVGLSKNAIARVRDINNGNIGHLRILTVQGCLEPAVEIITVFSEQYPDIKIEMEVVTGARQMSSIYHKDADIYISFSKLLNDYPQLNSKLIRHKQYSLVLPPGYKEDIDPSDLSVLNDMPLVCEQTTEAPYLVDEVFKICQRRGYHPENVNWVNSAIALLLQIKCGLGFSIIPTSGAGYFTDDLCKIPIQGEDAVADDSIGWWKEAENPAVKSFLKVVEELFPDKS